MRAAEQRQQQQLVRLGAERVWWGEQLSRGGRGRQQLWRQRACGLARDKS